MQGRGALNAYARGAVRATAWLAPSIERQRDMLRLSLFDVLVGGGRGRVLGGCPIRHGRLLEAATKAALLGLIAWGVAAARPRNLTVAALLAGGGDGHGDPPLHHRPGRRRRRAVPNLVTRVAPPPPLGGRGGRPDPARGGC